jgi:hypothetical protein
MNEIAWFMLALLGIGSLGAAVAVMGAFGLDRLQKVEAQEQAAERAARRKGEQITPSSSGQAGACQAGKAAAKT